MSVSDEYLAKIKRRFKAYDLLPPEVRAVMREAYSDKLDPLEAVQFTRLSSFKPAALAANLAAQDAGIAQEKEATLRTFTAPDRAKAVADRAMYRAARGRR